MKMITRQIMKFRILVVALLFFTGLKSASADQFTELCKQAPIIVRAKILALEPGVAISDFTCDFVIKAEVALSAKGKLSNKEQITIVIRLPMNDKNSILCETPCGMKIGEYFILFIRPHYSADGKTIDHYRFTEIPLGCLPHDLYTWSLLERTIKENASSPKE